MVCFSCKIRSAYDDSLLVLPAPMAHRAAPTSVSVALGQASANAVRATAGAGSLVAPRVTLPHSFLIYRAPDEKAVSTIFKVFGMTRLGLEHTAFRL